MTRHNRRQLSPDPAEGANGTPQDLPAPALPKAKPAATSAAAKVATVSDDVLAQLRADNDKMRADLDGVRAAVQTQNGVLSALNSPTLPDASKRRTISQFLDAADEFLFPKGTNALK